MTPILAATDLSARSDRAVARAADLARRQGARLILLAVVDDDRPHAVVLADEEETRTTLEAQGEQIDGIEVMVRVETGHPAAMIGKVASEEGAELVVLGPHRNRGLSDVFGRPSLSRILGGIDRPVLIARGRSEKPYETVMVGWDFSPAGASAAKLARDVAPDGKVTLGHVFTIPNMGMGYATHAAAEYTQVEHDRQEQALKEDAARLGGDAIDTVLRVGPPVDAIAQMAKEAGSDLLAIGRHARGPVARLVMGETAMSLALATHCDVLIAPPMEE